MCYHMFVTYCNGHLQHGNILLVDVATAMEVRVYSHL